MPKGMTTWRWLRMRRWGDPRRTRTHAQHKTDTSTHSYVLSQHIGNHVAAAAGSDWSVMRPVGVSERSMAEGSDLAVNPAFPPKQPRFRAKLIIKNTTIHSHTIQTP